MLMSRFPCGLTGETSHAVHSAGNAKHHKKGSPLGLKKTPHMPVLQALCAPSQDCTSGTNSSKWVGQAAMKCIKTC
eukprot:8789266-Ditylum_brightwellii.AAC.1